MIPLNQVQPANNDYWPSTINATQISLYSNRPIGISGALPSRASAKYALIRSTHDGRWGGAVSPKTVVDSSGCVRSAHDFLQGNNFQTFPEVLSDYYFDDHCQNDIMCQNKLNEQWLSKGRIFNILSGALKSNTQQYCIDICAPLIFECDLMSDRIEKQESDLKRQHDNYSEIQTKMLSEQRKHEKAIEKMQKNFSDKMSSMEAEHKIAIESLSSKINSYKLVQQRTSLDLGKAAQAEGDAKLLVDDVLQRLFESKMHILSLQKESIQSKRLIQALNSLIISQQEQKLGKSAMAEITSSSTEKIQITNPKLTAAEKAAAIEKLKNGESPVYHRAVKLINPKCTIKSQDCVIAPGTDITPMGSLGYGKKVTTLLDSIRAGGNLEVISKRKNSKRRKIAKDADNEKKIDVMTVVTPSKSIDKSVDTKKKAVELPAVSSSGANEEKKQSTENASVAIGTSESQTIIPSGNAGKENEKVVLESKAVQKEASSNTNEEQNAGDTKMQTQISEYGSSCGTDSDEDMNSRSDSDSQSSATSRREDRGTEVVEEKDAKRDSDCCI